MTYAAALFCATVTVAGCSGGAAQPAATTPVARSSVVASSTPSTPRETSDAGPQFPAGLPEAAKTKDKAGAEAFVRYFISELNASWRNPDPERLKPLCQPASKSCLAFQEVAADLAREGNKYAHDPVRIDRLLVLASTGAQRRVQMLGGQTGAEIVNGAGRVVDSDKKSTTDNMFYLRWGPTGWTVEAVKDVAG
jgi:hypothetical protein